MVVGSAWGPAPRNWKFLPF